MSLFSSSLLVLLAVIYFIADIQCRSIAKYAMKDEDKMKYLIRYGYLNQKGRTRPSPKDMRAAVAEFQIFVDLPPTGEIDKETAEMMDKDRCGTPDTRSSMRSNDFARRGLFGTKWPSPNVTWSLNTVDGVYDRDSLNEIIKSAKKEWEAPTKLKLKESDRNQATIVVDFLWPRGDGFHKGDSIPFAEKDLAHAFFPGETSLSGDIHVDLSKRFSMQQICCTKATDMKWMMIHEIGHALGLDHTSSKQSVMFPISPHHKFYQLSLEDVANIQTLYGVNPDWKNEASTTCSFALSAITFGIFANLAPYL